jgi:hypothetical protein
MDIRRDGTTRYSINELIRELNFSNIFTSQYLTEIIALYAHPAGFRLMFLHYGGFGGSPILEIDKEKQKLENNNGMLGHKSQRNITTKSINELNTTYRLYFPWVYKIPMSDEVIDENNRIKRQLHKTVWFSFSCQLNLANEKEMDGTSTLQFSRCDELCGEEYVCHIRPWGYIRYVIDKDGIQDVHVSINMCVDQFPQEFYQAL